jgi:predicted RNase H-like nuclease
MARAVGADGCRGGWIAACRNDSGNVAFEVHSSFAALVDSLAPDIVAVDMPIGLPERTGPGGRGPERLVRPLLGGRRSSVFAIPSRCAVYAGLNAKPGLPDDGYRQACAVARATSDPPRAVSKQAFHLFPKIVEIDRWLCRSGSAMRVIESHPEVAFWAMNGGNPLPEPKIVRGRVHEPGLTLRRDLLDRAEMPVPHRTAPPRGADWDDLVDACATLWVAECFVRGTARSFPDAPLRDACGFEIAIWTGETIAAGDVKTST